MRLSSTFRTGLKPKQRLQSRQYQDFSIFLATKVSYRVAIEIMQRAWHQDGTEILKRSTYEERIESVGASLNEAIEKKSETILSGFGIEASAIITENAAIPLAVKSPSLPAEKGEPEIRFQIREFNRGRESETKIRYCNRTQHIEGSEKRCCYISIDDILVKSQKDNRIKGHKKAHKFVSNTVVHIQYEEHSYTLTAAGLDKAMKRTLAFLLSNHLLEDSRLIFFSDGAACIRDAIDKYFSFREYTLILDWYHLKLKCDQFLSMGIKGSKEQRKCIKEKLAAILWAGNVDKAKQYVQGLSRKFVKNLDKLKELIAYLDRKSPNIASYALRDAFGLRNSSNLVEKANDRVVAVRQKKKGMSWSNQGSNALAIINAVRINGELSDWILKKEIPFKMAV